MPELIPCTWQWCSERPHWYRDGGILVSEYSIYGRRSRPEKLLRWKPSIAFICDPLMGSSALSPSEDRVVSFPPLHRALAFYEEGLNLIAVFGEREDVFALALYRRQVRSVGDISLDRRFLALAEAVRPALTSAEWKMLVTRMPEGSRIRQECLRRSGGLVLNEETRLSVPSAAE